MKKRSIAFFFAIVTVFSVCFSFVSYGEESTDMSEVSSTGAVVRKQYSRDELVCTYTFNVYGYGHGVGMSQLGAVAYADTDGRYKWNYVQILMHYYPQTHMAYDENRPSTITRGGVTYDLRDFLARSTLIEIGGYCDASVKEAHKTQVVATYTFLKHFNYKISSAGVAYTSRTPSKLIYDCVDEVIGQYLAYNGSNKPASCMYSASFCGYTADSAETWEGAIQGLSGGVFSPEKVSISTVTMDAEDIIAIADSYNVGKSEEKKIVLSGNPAQWLEIVEHDGAYSENIGYVVKIRIGNRTFSGNTFRNILAGVSGVPKLRSHCFSLTYDLVPGEDVAGNASEAYTDEVFDPEMVTEE